MGDATEVQAEPRFWSIDMVAAAYEVNRSTIERMMRDTREAGIAAPWFMFRSKAQWVPDQIPKWLKELEEWRISRSAAASTSSGGGRSRGTRRPESEASERGRATPRRTPKRSSATSKPSELEEGIGQLLRMIPTR